MRLFGKPGGSRAQARAAFLTIPFDLPGAAPFIPTPDVVLRASRRGHVLRASPRGKTFRARHS